MKNMQKLFLQVLSDYIDDYGTDELFEELFPGRDVAEVFYEMYESGMIPEDLMEKFLNDE